MLKINSLNLTHDPITGKGVRAAEGTQPTQTQTVRIMRHSGSSCEVGTFPARAGPSVHVAHVLDAARAHERRDALEALDARTWVDVAERSEFRTAVRRTAASSQASFTFHKHRMHTPTWLMHGSRQ